MKKPKVKLHMHDNVSPASVGLVLGALTEMSGRQGWFYAGRIGSELKIGVTQGCPFCRMDQQYLSYLGIAFSDDCYAHESRMKRALGKPSHGNEYFSNWECRFQWLCENRFVRSILEIEVELARKFG